MKIYETCVQTFVLSVALLLKYGYCLILKLQCIMEEIIIYISVVKNTQEYLEV